jgi:hypothetical protein
VQHPPSLFARSRFVSRGLTLEIMQAIDIDDPTTWPEQISEPVFAWAQFYRGSTNYTGDLALSLELEEPFRGLFTGFLLRAHHYTRLLPHERAMVLEKGLRPLSPELLFDRIESARSTGMITRDEADTFHRAHVFATGEHQNREGQVCLVLSKHVFERDPEACRPLLGTWGGEGMYMSSGAVPLRQRLRTLGSPTTVTALLDLSPGRSRHLVFPALHKVFIGAVLGLPDVGADVFYRAPIPPEHIESVVHH